MTFPSLFTRSFLLAACFVALVWHLPPAHAGSVQSFTFGAKTYPGSRDREYKVYVPSRLPAQAPMVMALHGCRQTHDDVINDWGLTAAADRHGFVLVAPFITSYDGARTPNCWGFWFDGHRHEGRGEPEDLHQIAMQVESRFTIDGTRRFITGLSSGAAMAVVAATTHNHYWAAAASAAGLPYGEEPMAVAASCSSTAAFHTVTRVAADMRRELNDAYPIPLLVLQNASDCTVQQAAGRNLRDAHLAVFGSADHRTADTARASQAACTPINGPSNYGCQHTIYTADGRAGNRSVVETVIYTGPVPTPNPLDTDHGHYWIGGANGSDGKWAIKLGPSYPEIVWEFFSRNSRQGASGVPRLTLVGTSPMTLEKGAVFSDPGAIATDAEDGTLAALPTCSVDTARPGRYGCTYRATDSNGNTATALREVIVVDNSPKCTRIAKPPAAHIAAGRAVAGGWWGMRAFSLTDKRDIGFSWDTWYASVTLREGRAGEWYATVPPGCSP